MSLAVRIRRATSRTARTNRLLARLKRDLDRRSLRERPAQKPQQVKQ